MRICKALPGKTVFLTYSLIHAVSIHSLDTAFFPRRKGETVVLESIDRGAWRKIKYICILDFRETRKQMKVKFFKSRALITSKSPT